VEGAIEPLISGRASRFSRIFMKDRLNALIRVAKLLQVVSGRN
jgi:hypothetical protein